MRLVGEFKDEVRAIEFMSYLQGHNIDSSIDHDEEQTSVWVYDEAHVKQAKKLLDEFNAGKRSCTEKKAPKSRPDIPAFEDQNDQNDQKMGEAKPPHTFTYQPYVTKALLILCVVVFIISSIQRYSKDGVHLGGGFYPPIAKELFMDYPKAFEIRDELDQKYGREAVQKNQLPSEAAPLVQEFGKHPPWMGIYNIMLSPKDHRAILWKGEFLSKVRHGQIWRLFTPVILHIGFLHLLFNMLWLVVLGKMVEFNMGRIRFVLFILVTGIFSNLCQYIMTGPLFLGISGVLAAFIGYIWVRKKIAPWEVYFIRKETLYFFFSIIFGFLAIQIVSFILQYFNIYSLPIPIANTGHISGLIIGMILARLGWMGKKVS